MKKISLNITHRICDSKQVFKRLEIGSIFKPYGRMAGNRRRVSDS